MPPRGKVRVARPVSLVLAGVLACVGVGLVGAGLGRPGPPAPPTTTRSTTARSTTAQSTTAQSTTTHGARGMAYEPLPAVSRAGALLTVSAVSAAPIPAPPSARSSPAAVPDIAPGLPRSAPVRLRVPAIGVDTAVMSVGLNGDGTVEVPPLGKDSPAGWYRYLASPGEAGPAVILGHVDSAADGPAVFYRLGDLRPGDTITVSREDGSVATFRATRVAQYPKDAFPSQAVYGATGGVPALRLVTCGGAYDPSRREYTSNVVAFAEAA